jgi:hypothetical protein
MTVYYLIYILHYHANTKKKVNYMNITNFFKLLIIEQPIIRHQRFSIRIDHAIFKLNFFYHFCEDLL